MQVSSGDFTVPGAGSPIVPQPGAVGLAGFSGSAAQGAAALSTTSMPLNLGAMYTTLAQHGLPDAAIKNYLAQQLLMRQHMERIHQLAQHELEMEQAKAKFAEAQKAQALRYKADTVCKTEPGPPAPAATVAPAPQSAPEDDDEVPVGEPATADTGNWDGETADASDLAPTPAHGPMIVAQEDDWGLGSNVLPDGMPSEGEWLDGMGDELWLNEANSTADLGVGIAASHLPITTSHPLPGPSTAAPRSTRMPVEQIDDCTPASEVGDMPTSPEIRITPGATQVSPALFTTAIDTDEPNQKRQKVGAGGGSSDRRPASNAAVTSTAAATNKSGAFSKLPPPGLRRPQTLPSTMAVPSSSSGSSSGSGRSNGGGSSGGGGDNGSRSQKDFRTGRAGTPPDARRPALSTAAAAAASPLNDVRAIVQAATFRMLTWQEAAVVLRHSIGEHQAKSSGGDGGAKLLGPRPDVVISQNPAEQAGALFVEMPKVPRKFFRLKHQKGRGGGGAGRAGGKDAAEAAPVMPDRWRNSGGGKGSSDLPKGSPQPTVRRRYGAVVPAAATVGSSSSQRKLKREHSLRYYEYTLLEHKPNGEVGEHECYLFHVIRPGVPRAANS